MESTCSFSNNSDNSDLYDEPPLSFLNDIEPTCSDDIIRNLGNNSSLSMGLSNVKRSLYVTRTPTSFNRNSFTCALPLPPQIRSTTPQRRAMAPKLGQQCCRLQGNQVAEMLKENMRFMEMNPTPGCFVRKNSPFSIIESSQLDEEYPHDIILVDCRWNFEYDGGHIHSATNYNDAQKMRNDLVVEKLLSLNPDTDIIFYCEFSQVRAVKMSDYLCKIDSIYNKDPQFSKIYVLDGGYSKFFEEYPELSTTGRYVTEKTREYELYVSKYSNFGKYDMNIPDIEVPIDEVE
ncbi:Rhodanese-like_domain-containing protein [Hexamita inflata]|uniref:protein-tyrosine-phosphatase n=1 Tax=Hexamita inflata TaxID=28002 RepID=A0AA86Q547_9EUKA|nr:Rhodanese-like domain-containing protein [Hexamita inflata]